MNISEFLFPKYLEINKTNFKKALIIGSCLSEAYTKFFRLQQPETIFNHILYNNVGELPAIENEELRSYNFQYIQIPIRTILSDLAIRVTEWEKNDVDLLSAAQDKLDQILPLITIYSKQGLLTFVSNFIVPQGRASASLAEQDSETDLTYVIRQLNNYLAKKIREFDNCYLADVDYIANSMGKRYFLDDIIGFYTHGALFYSDWAGHESFPFWTAPAPGRIEQLGNLSDLYENRNEEFLNAVFRQIETMYRTVHQIDSVKLVIFDLDNTLWRGQLVEHYQKGLRKPYSDGWPLGIWEAIQHLRRRGIIVAIVSKNDEKLVEEMWDEAVQPPFLKIDDFTIRKIGWKPKAEYIQEILNDLSLTSKSTLFVDDNPVERESVCARFPEIRTIGRDPFTVRRALLWSSETQIASRSAETKNREHSLRQKIVREESKAKMTREEFLASLNSKVQLLELRSTEDRVFQRLFELVNKTNQFNTTGERRDIDFYASHLENSGRIFYFSVTDKFTEYGIVGVILTTENYVTQFVMSCRVLGMEIEIAVLNKIIEIIFASGHDKIGAHIVETDANTPCRDVFTRAGFRKAEKENSFTISLSDKKNEISHIAMAMS